MKTAWCVSVDYNYPVTYSLLSRRHYERYKVWCGVNIYDSFCVTGREHAVRKKVRLFDQYILVG